MSKPKFEATDYTNTRVEMVHWRPYREGDKQILEYHRPEEREAGSVINERLKILRDSGVQITWVDMNQNLDHVNKLPDIEIRVGGASLGSCVDKRMEAHRRVGNNAQIDYELAMRLQSPMEKLFGENPKVWGKER